MCSGQTSGPLPPLRTCVEGERGGWGGGPGGDTVRERGGWGGGPGEDTVAEQRTSCVAEVVEVVVPTWGMGPSEG